MTGHHSAPGTLSRCDTTPIADGTRHVTLSSERRQAELSAHGNGAYSSRSAEFSLCSVDGACSPLFVVARLPRTWPGSALLPSVVDAAGVWVVRAEVACLAAMALSSRGCAPAGVIVVPVPTPRAPFAGGVVVVNVSATATPLLAPSAFSRRVDLGAESAAAAGVGACLTGTVAPGGPPSGSRQRKLTAWKRWGWE
jgi:hypothetical protein